MTIERTKFEQMVNVGGVTKEVTSNVTSLSPVQLTDRQKEISKMMLNNPRISVKEMSLVLSLAERTIRRDLSVLQTKGFIRHDGPDKGGRWVVIKGKLSVSSERLLVLLILLNNMPKNGLRTKIMGFANKMSESIIAERLYWCSRNAILFANCSQNKEKGATFLM